MNKKDRIQKKNKANDRLADTMEDVHPMGKILHQNATLKQSDEPKQVKKDKTKPEQCNRQQNNSFHHRPVNRTERQQE